MANIISGLSNLRMLISSLSSPVPIPMTKSGFDQQALLDELTRDEGYRKSAYQDHLGYWTIGIGRLVDKGKRAGLTREEAQYLLSNDVKRFEGGLDKRLPWWRELDDVRQRVILNMAFNMGVTGLLSFRNTLKAVKEGRYEDASRGMLKSKWAGQVGSRAKRLSKMMLTGKT